MRRGRQMYMYVCMCIYGCIIWWGLGINRVEVSRCRGVDAARFANISDGNYMHVGSAAKWAEHRGMRLIGFSLEQHLVDHDPSPSDLAKWYESSQSALSMSAYISSLPSFSHSEQAEGIKDEKRGGGGRETKGSIVKAR